MQITLRFQADADLPRLRWYPVEKTRTFEVPESIDIADILPQVHAKGLARYVDTLLGPEIRGGYERSGRLEQSKTYNILSKDIPKTIKALDELRELKF